MSGYQEINLQIRSSQVETLRTIAQKEHGSGNEIEKVIFSALLNYFESSTTNEMLEEAVKEGLQVLEDHVKVLLDLIKTLLISASYDTTKIRVLLEFLFENDIGKDLIPELYKRTNESVIERLKEESLEGTAQMLTENEHLRRQLMDYENQASSRDAKKQAEETKKQDRDREYAQTVQRLTQQVSQNEQLQKQTATWVNGLMDFLSKNSGDPQTLIATYTARYPKPQGIR